AHQPGARTRGSARGSRADRARRPRDRRGPGRVERREDPLHGLAGRRACGGARVRLPGEGGDGRAGRHGRDARARRRAPGARGGPAENLPGPYYAPAILSDVPPGTRLATEPVDGPVLAVQAVDSEDEAIAAANASDYGLGASVWTADRYRGTRIARELNAGMV